MTNEEILNFFRGMAKHERDNDSYLFTVPLSWCKFPLLQLIASRSIHHEWACRSDLPCCYIRDRATTIEPSRFMGSSVHKYGCSVKSQVPIGNSIDPENPDHRGYWISSLKEFSKLLLPEYKELFDVALEEYIVSSL